MFLRMPHTETNMQISIGGLNQQSHLHVSSASSSRVRVTPRALSPRILPWLSNKRRPHLKTADIYTPALSSPKRKLKLQYYGWCVNSKSIKGKSPMKSESKLNKLQTEGPAESSRWSIGYLARDLRLVISGFIPRANLQQLARAFAWTHKCSLKHHPRD